MDPNDSLMPGETQKIASLAEIITPRSSDRWNDNALTLHARHILLLFSARFFVLLVARKSFSRTQDVVSYHLCHRGFCESTPQSFRIRSAMSGHGFSFPHGRHDWNEYIGRHVETLRSEQDLESRDGIVRILFYLSFFGWTLCSSSRIPQWLEVCGHTKNVPATGKGISRVMCCSTVFFYFSIFLLLVFPIPHESASEKRSLTDEWRRAGSVFASIQAF